MEPSVSTEGEQKERKKIQFAVPTSAPSNLDPRQVEMIRRRRPTPATLFRVADQASPDDDPSSHQWVVGENGILKPKRINQNVYQPPSLKAVQKMAEAHMQHLGVYTALEDPCEDEEEEQDWQDWQGEDDHQDTATPEQPDRPSPKKIQAATDEDEAEEEEEKSNFKNNMKGTTEEHNRCSD
ncbi:protein phosphatase 1 regulatory subunit 1B isoform X2 [Periophthalmus magnuspinnatus]|uniref:protein phosphatase 1 regulatory subunit 1B isoform X2 n=1 Tax=Periophthalmus magnuspinnatus TaxID=409849 RepID=UPI00145A8544|nr:protein phosphatase 1 regulatory subunit 1B isoform X2 [Periophthalmus magnuspinnatus]